MTPDWRALVACGIGVASCSQRPVPVPPPPHTIAAPSVALPVGPPPPDGTTVTLTPDPHGAVGLSPDERVIVASVKLEPGGGSMVAFDVEHPTAPPRVVGAGVEADEVRFVGPSRLLARSRRRGELAVVRLDASFAERVPSVSDLAVTRDGRWVATLDASGNLAIRAADTLAVAWAPDDPPFPADTSIAVAHGRWFVVSRPGRVAIFDPESRRRMFQTKRTEDIPISTLVSPKGRWVATTWYEGGAGHAELVEVDGTRRLAWDAAWTAASFGAAESVFVAADSPLGFVRVTLPALSRTDVPTRLSFGESGYGPPGIDGIATTDDGRTVCGHPTEGKYTNPRARVFAGPPEARRAAMECYLIDDRAIVAAVPAAVARDGRRVLASANATYTHTANTAISPDGTVAGLVAARLSRDPPTYSDVEITLFEVKTGAILGRVPLPDGPAAMGETLSWQFSPSGRILDVSFGFNRPVRIDVRHALALPPPEGVDDFTYSASETFTSSTSRWPSLHRIATGERVDFAIPGGKMCLRQATILPGECPG